MDDKHHITVLQEYMRKYKKLPSFAGIQKLLGFRSKGSVTYLFRRLIQAGYFKKEGYSFVPQERFFAHKVYHSVRAGFPSPGDEENAHNIDLDTYLMPHPTSTVMIRVQGDSMIDAGIFTGDIVIVDRGQRGKVNDIIVAEVDREYTLKYLKRDSKGYYLQAGNKKYPPIHPKEELKIFGVVIGVVRKYSI